jgi:phospholipid/cholesterol/gamma-HCH transport system ATP-binding protein
VTDTTAAEPSRAAAAPLVSLEDVHYAVDGRAIFDGLSLAIQPRLVTAIMGPSGVGKTTLLRLITGQLRADRGRIVVGGLDLRHAQRAQLYALRRRMGMLFQNGALLTDLDVYENVAYPLREHTRLQEPLVARVVLTKLQAVGLRGAARLMPAQLSGGMGRRVALARAIVMDPELLIYDEPFAGLDPIALGVVLRLIRRLNDVLGITSVVVSHDVREIALLADAAYLLSSRRVVASGTMDRLRSDQTPEVQQFIAGHADGPVPFHYPAPEYVSQLLDQELPV